MFFIGRAGLDNMFSCLCRFTAWAGWVVWNGQIFNFHLRDLFSERYWELRCGSWKLGQASLLMISVITKRWSKRHLRTTHDLIGLLLKWQSNSTLLEVPLTNDANEHTVMLPTTLEIDQILIRRSASLLKIVV